MQILKLAFRRETAMPMYALTFSSAVSVALVIARIGWTGKYHYAFLAWNLFLAWLPLIFALLADEKYRQGKGRRWHFATLTGAWLLFFPNAPYIFTDLIHLNNRYFGHFWVDLMLILSCAFTGLVLGFLSLYLIQSIVVRRFGQVAGWGFVASVAWLSSFGIYLGRFLRFNSWDVLFRPVKLYQGIGHWVSDPMANSSTFAFPVLFATFLFIAYVMLYAFTHLQPAAPVSLESRRAPIPEPC